jgi:tRNA (guanine9-N1)-methyltransferase
LSKTQRKKLEKRQKINDLRQELRKRKREKLKLKKALNKEQGIKSSKPSRKQLQRNKIKLGEAEISLVIDLNFDDLMVSRDMTSCASQLMRVYTANRRAKIPLPIHFTSLKEGSEMYQKLTKNDGFKHWDIFTNEKHFSELFDKDKIVYLTSESDTTLDELEKGCVYVIGGLVDHNKYKGHTHQMAVKEGYRTARLPLTENVVLHSRAVLTINHVAEIMIAKSDGKSWKDVFLEVLPTRKVAGVKEDCEKKEDENKEEES